MGLWFSSSDSKSARRSSREGDGGDDGDGGGDDDCDCEFGCDGDDGEEEEGRSLMGLELEGEWARWGRCKFLNRVARSSSLF